MSLHATASYNGQDGWIETDPGYFQVELCGSVAYMDGECIEVIGIFNGYVMLYNSSNESLDMFMIPEHQFKRDFTMHKENN